MIRRTLKNGRKYYMAFDQVKISISSTFIGFRNKLVVSFPLPCCLFTNFIVHFDKNPLHFKTVMKSIRNRNRLWFSLFTHLKLNLCDIHLISIVSQYTSTTTRLSPSTLSVQSETKTKQKKMVFNLSKSIFGWFSSSIDHRSFV